MKYLLNKTTTKQTFTKLLERLHKYLKNLCKKFMNYESDLNIIRPTKKGIDSVHAD